MTEFNDQHMRAMGLSPALLGKAATSEHATDRCPSALGDDRCARVIGHQGSHARGALTWTGDATLASEGPTKQREGDQRLPHVNERRDIQSLLIEDINARREVGISRYGTALQPFNGRDTIRDAFDEAVDLATYLRSLLEMRAALSDDLIANIFEVLQEQYSGDRTDEHQYETAERVVERMLDVMTLIAVQVQR